MKNIGLVVFRASYSGNFRGLVLFWSSYSEENLASK